MSGASWVTRGARVSSRLLGFLFGFRFGPFGSHKWAVLAWVCVSVSSSRLGSWVNGDWALGLGRFREMGKGKWVVRGNGGGSWGRLMDVGSGLLRFVVFGPKASPI